MIFQSLNESAERDELMLVEGGICQYHLRKDNQLTIANIFSTQKGAGSLMLERLRLTPGARSLFAKCPANLEANAWYAMQGFHVERMEVTKTGRKVLHWRLDLTEQKRRPNVGRRMELIYCAGGNRRYAQIAIDQGWRYGARLPDTVYFRPYFVDHNFENPPTRERYMALLAEHQPHLATIWDWQRLEQLDEVMSWAEEAAKYVSGAVIIVPKVEGEVWRVPDRIGGKPIRLGYSVPSRLASTPCQLHEFGDRRVHLLGGSPKKQFKLADVLNVLSADMNYHQKVAQYTKFWTHNSSIGRVRNWPTLDEVDAYYEVDANYHAFKRSCRNIKAAWERVIAKEQRQKAIPQLMLWQADEL